MAPRNGAGKGGPSGRGTSGREVASGQRPAASSARQVERQAEAADTRIFDVDGAGTDAGAAGEAAHGAVAVDGPLGGRAGEVADALRRAVVAVRGRAPG